MSTFPFMEHEANPELGDGLNLLDEFLDQRVYETPSGLASELKTDLMEDNLGFDLDMNMYKGSPEWQSAIQTAFHSPEESYYSAGNLLASNNGGVTPEAEPSNPSSSKLSNTAPRTPSNRNSSAPAASFNLQRSNGTKSNGVFMKTEGMSPDSYDLGKASVLSHTASNSDAENSNSVTSSDSDYDHARSRLAKLKFGNPMMKSCPDSIEPDPSYLDFSQPTISALPYKLSISNVPNFLRVETQIKLRISLSPSPSQYLLHVPQDVISKNKFCLKDPIESLSHLMGDKLLYLDVFVMTSNLQKSCTICSRCIRREQKRALRRKSGAFDDDESLKNNTLWSDENMSKKAIIFNCKEVVSFPPPNGLAGDHKLMELSARIVCYCRHHLELSGFKLLFVVKDYLGNVVAKEVLTPIMIMDRKKTGNSSLSGPVQSMDVASSSTSLNQPKNLNPDHSHPSKENSPMHPISPNSIDDLSEPTNTDTNDERGLKRKKLSVDDSLNALNLMFNGINFLPISNSDTNASTHNYFAKPLFQQPSMQAQQVLAGPTIQRIIPAEGPIRGGIAVTLLGFNFRTGLRVKFGSNQALATHCWSETTIVTYLPPASQPGQVLVSFEGENMIPDQESVFTYTDDTDRQLIELALQIVGLKMNGKLEDAKNIARRIVGTDVGNASAGGNTGSNGSQTNVAGGQTRSNSNQLSLSSSETENWFEKVQQTAKKLTRSDLSSEDLLIQLLSLVDLPNCPLTLLNWLLPNQEGQLLLHLAALKNHRSLVNFLITRGCKVDTPDNLGLSPLFYASLCGHRELINIFLECRANHNLKLSNNLVLTDYCDLNVMDIFLDLSEIEEVGGLVNKSKSVDSLYLMFARNYGRHVLKMVEEEKAENSTDHEIEAILDGYEEDESDFADSEGESETEIVGDRGLESSRSIETEPRDAQAADINVNNSIWQRVKSAFTNEAEDVELPSYDDLFPFGHTAKPEVVDLEPPVTSPNSKTIEAGVAEYSNEVTLSALQEEDGITSDSSEDMVFSRKFQMKRKTVKNDKMLLFFWFPVLIVILLLFIVSSLGYKFEFIESLKDLVRVTIGNFMLGNERLIRVFKPETIAEIASI